MNELLTIAELAAVLKVRKSWIYGRTSTNTLPYIKVGRHLRFQKAKVFEALGIEQERVDFPKEDVYNRKQVKE